MHTDITQKEMPTGSVNYPAGHTDTLIVPGIADPGNKAFVTLRAQFALRGHALHRTSPVDGAGTYYAERWGGFGTCRPWTTPSVSSSRSAAQHDRLERLSSR
ncbi:MAG: hypothetical protein IPL15_24900 [Comamonadaceae bacterium]|uniref:hypothetical protein n=1 Tax=Candidatus Skiveiella danica TaxID=3386177 RepID=UPI00390B519C|nr:hypothetical protein [Comamonadaceae bacterium]